MVGTQLGPYELLEELGAGGMAAVYRAYQANMARQVAVKVIYQELADDLGRDQFQREARLIARLEHPHILPVYDFDSQSDPPYIVMRYLSGGTLKETWPVVTAELRGAAVWRLALRWLNQLADALDYAHRQGIIHRDIKPSNIILDAEKNLFLADFGLASLAGDLSSLTSEELLGTPLYASPEQALGAREIGVPADLYALGVVTFELLTGQVPFEADTLYDLLQKHAYAPPPSITRFNPQLPPPTDEVFFRALAKKPADRYPNAAALVDALALALGLSFSHSGATLTAVSAQTRPAEQNKVVTLLCIDVANYAAWLTDNARPTRQLETLWGALEPVLTAEAGNVVQREEDTLVAVWGAHTTSEDDAAQAVRAALALTAAAQPWLAEAELTLSVGVHTGPALLTTTPGTQTFTASGPTLSVAQRLAEEAEGRVLISLDTSRVVLGTFDLEADAPVKVRGRKDPLPTFVVTAAKKRAFQLNTRGVEGLTITQVGREAQLKQLQRAYLTAFEDQEAQAITVLGEVGLGKSRLLAEFTLWMDARPEGIWLFQGRATPAMTGRPYALFRDLLSFRFEILESDPVALVQAKLEKGVAALLERAEPDYEMAHLVGHLAGFDLAASPHVRGLLNDPKQLTARARQLAQRLWLQAAQNSPVMIQLEDLHWADEASLELFGSLVTEATRAPLMVLALARPTLFTTAPHWGGGVEALRRAATPNHRLVELLPLDRHDSRALALELLQKVPDPPRALRDLLVERAEGNPLFMEELVKLLLEDRILVKEASGAWRVEASRLAHVRVPPTLISLLQTRFDTLLAPEKVVLQRAAVVGKVFYASALRALEAADEASLPELDAVLEQLAERGFVVRRSNSAFAGDREFLFAQAILREAVYAALPARQLRRYHAAVAHWFNAASGLRRGEYLPLIAEHYEKAGDLPRAFTALHEAGEQALRVSAYLAARDFFTRGLALAQAFQRGVTPSVSATTGEGTAISSEMRVSLLLEIGLGEVYNELAEFASATQHLEAALATARRFQAGPQIALTLSGLGEIAFSRGDFATAKKYYTEALPLAEATGDQSFLARVQFELGSVAWRQGTPALASDYFSQSLATAQQINDKYRMVYAINGLGLAARIAGNLDESQRNHQAALDLALEIGLRERAMTCLNNLGTVVDERKDYVAALDYYRRAQALAVEIGSQDTAALLSLNLANTLIKCNQLDEARQATREGLALARRLGATPWVLWGILVHARLAAVSGDVPRALALLGVADQHPTANNDLRRNMRNITKECGIDPALVEPGMAVGRAWDFEQTLAELT